MSEKQLIELRGEVAPGTDEVTLYVKGFLGRGEASDRFESWLDSHLVLEDSHGWSERALGYHWPAGRLVSRSALALRAVKGAWDVFRIVRDVRRAVRVAWGGMLAEEVALAASHFAWQYVSASRMARLRAEDLAALLDQLGREHARVRVVAHSLGCRHLIEASARLDPGLRPHEIHLCAPACREQDVAELLPGLAREQTWLYHTRKDRVLDLAFPVLARGRALGHTGPQQPYAGLSPLDVSEAFDFWVHNEYPRRFPRLVPT